MKTAMDDKEFEAVGCMVRTKRRTDGTGGFFVAKVDHGIAGGHFLAKAFAAAPEMFYALTALVSRAEDMQAALRAFDRWKNPEDWTGDELARDAQPAIDDAKAVIAALEEGL